MATVALVLFLLIQVPASSPRISAPDLPPSGPPKTFRTDASAAEIEAAGAELVESYGAFAVARGTIESMGLLLERGRYAEPIIGGSTLEMLGGAVDIATLGTRPNPAWPVDAAGATVGVVHFHAPIKVEWKTALESLGLNVLRYLPQNAFVARGPPSAFVRLASLPAVDWVGPYASGWKIRPGASGPGLVDVRVVVLPGGYPETVEAWLGHQGIPLASGTGSGPSILGAFGAGDFRWIRARIPAALIPSLADLPTVEFIDPVQPVHPLNAETDWVIQSNLTNNYRYWNFGLDARGQIIGMADTGIDYDGTPFRQSSSIIVLGDIYNTTDPARRKIVRYLNMGVRTGQLTWPGGGGLWDPWSIKDCPDGHGTGVASTLAGYDNPAGGSSPNDGNAVLGKIYMEDIGGLRGSAACPPTGTGEGLIYLPENYADLFGPPGLVYNDPLTPVRVHSNSWGGDANVYDVQARMVDAFVWAHPDMTILFAAGNCITVGCPLVGSVGTPSTAKDIVSVGGAYNPDTGSGLDQNDLASQSSRGPTLDGRIKPTIVTIFDGDSAMSDGDPMSGAGLSDLHWAGTSYSTPAAAAAAAIIRQYFTDGWYPAGRPVAANAMSPSAALVRAMLIASGTQVTGSGTVSRSASDTWPNNEQGFGRVLLSNVLPIAAAGDTFRTQVIDGSAGLLTGEAAAYTFHVGSVGPVKFVLTWSDYPGTLGATKALVNDLDLEVTAPDGTVYRGNHFAPFAQGQSLPGGTFDATNVEEAVILKAAMAGDWSARIIGSNVPVGPQPFALVATGRLDGSYGRVVLDRVAYSESDTIRIEVEDSSATSVTVHVSSGIEPAGEDRPLAQLGPDEVWRGSIPTAFGTAATDGVLQVRDGDLILASYQDLSPPHTNTVTAHVLARGPTIHDVTVSQISATGATIGWTTNEPGTTEVRYGTDPSALSSMASTADLVTNHAIPLARLNGDTLYYFEVTSRGRLGNATTDRNGGLLYRLETPPLGDVLLVIGGTSFPPEREASYAAALRANGWTWSFWRIADLGTPPLGIVQARRVVIWQVGLEQYPPFNATERTLVKSYLDEGGRLIVSSHDATWALSDSLSAFSTPESAAWVRGVLKATFVCDPTTIVRVSGVTSDPISGAYTGGVAYTPHREGGADDEFTTNAAGGSSTLMWTDDSQVTGCNPSNRPVGLRWVSSSPNGTAGNGVWGGTRSRLAYFAFEITSLDTTATDLNPASPTRAAILDAALRWLLSASSTTLDRDHPDVNITSPNGGRFSGASIPITWTAAAYGSGVVIANFTLDVSDDGGQSWTTLANLSGSARAYTWNLGPAPNGNRYVLRITSRDTGTPTLSGTDLTDAPFAIDRPGGDVEGPVLWSGSVRVNPRPPGAAMLVTFTATADDRLRGGNDVTAAELFFQTAPPSSGDAGLGLPMAALDGRFDGTLENVSWQGGLPAPPGTACVWIHARDAAGNWGAYTPQCFVVINAGPDTVPPAPASADAVRSVNGNQDLSIRWLAPFDDNLFGGTTEYHVLRATSPQGPFVDVSGAIAANRSKSYVLLDPGRAADAPDYFYRIESIDAAGNTELSTSMAAKVRLSFLAGLNLLGMPLDLTDPSVGDLAAGRAWVDAWTYEACGSTFPWSSALPTDSTTFRLKAGRGFWLNGTTPDFVSALGIIEDTTRLLLCRGWNLIALPGFAAGVTVQNLIAATDAIRVMGFDVQGPYHVRDLNPTDVLVTGRGYWVFVPANIEWTIAGW